MNLGYIDPGTGSMLISAIIAMASVGFFMLKGVIYRAFGIDGDKGEVIDPNHKFGLVFYSEGKQYWNVFKPIVEACSKKGVDITYFTSDEKDPGLFTELPHVDARFIGTGREAYFVLNRLRCDMLVMTTPGLDVLEIKRSPHVKHYCHIGHATSSVAGYKSYALDYYDSVLLGGEGDKYVIRELEEKRNLPQKEIEIIGHTYLDVLRDEIEESSSEESLFNNNRPTVLISPTWGNHGLLTKYGDSILEVLDKADLFNVIIRPHPQSFVSDKELMNRLLKMYPNNANRVWDKERSNIRAMSHADIMISDFSGIIFDFYTLYKKPILTMHAQYEKRGRDAMDLSDDPWDLRMLNEIGRTLDEEDVENLPEIINRYLDKDHNVLTVDDEKLALMDKHPRESQNLGTKYILNKFEQLQQQIDVEDSIEPEKSEENYQDKPFFNRMLRFVTHTNTLLQLLIASCILSVLIYIGIKTLPEEGLNQVFLRRIMPLSLILNLILGVVFLLFVWFKDKGKFVYRKKSESIKLMNILLIALPLSPVIQYIIFNQDILNLKESLLVFLFFVIVSLVMVVVIPWLLSPIVSLGLTTAVMSSFLFTIINMASYGRTTRILYIGVILALLIIIISILILTDKTKMLIVISLVFFVTNTFTSVLNSGEIDDSDIVETDQVTPKLIEATKDKDVERSPDVFLLIYDSYANQETLETYGYDNSEQIEYLMDEGFTIYDGSYSVATTSLMSMAHVLNPERISHKSEDIRRIIARDSSSLRMFKNNKYLTKLIVESDYYTKGTVPDYDVSYPSYEYAIAPSKIIIDAILEGEFRFDIEFSTHEYSDYLYAKNKELKTKEERPVFMYSHDRYPDHSQNSGVLLPNETEIHFEGLDKANKEMRENIANLDLKNRDAIVIVAGDHGPYLTKNGIGLSSYDESEIDRLDIQDRHGTFLAIHWPDESYADKFDIKLIQDVMPAVAAYLYNDEEIFDKTRMDGTSINEGTIGTVSIDKGVIIGGKDDGKALFEKNGIRKK